MATIITAATSATSGPLQLRASSIPRFVRCPASETLPQVKNTSDAARLGTVVHLACENIVHERDTDLEALALLHDVPLPELKHLYFGARALWEEYGHFFPNPRTELEYVQNCSTHVEPHPEDFLLSGHADIVSHPDEKTVCIADWKSGRGEGDYGPQLKTYALLAYIHALTRDAETPLERVYAAIFWLRERQIEGQWFEAGVLLDWFRELQRAVVRAAEGELVVGAHCTHCPVANCPAFKTRAWSLMPVNAEMEVTDENALTVYETLKAFKKKADDALQLVEQHIRQNGPIDTPDGKQLTFRETTRESIVPRIDVMQHLSANIPAELVLDAMSFSKTKLMDALTADAPRGTKKQVIEETMAQLRKMGAVEQSTSTLLAIVKKET
ncbi:MAG: PD-(D/E)XK nuclease family protein [Armatimonadetes bacterium]|nr:PD-(D/E)XK nuclease family protein [Armatimonadota bacterium]